MNITDRINMFQAKHAEALETINRFVNMIEDYEQDCSKLIRWLMEYEVNPYAIFSEGWASCMSDAVSFAGLCHHIHHAMLDDGEIEFITVNDEPRIVFIERWRDNFNNLVLTEQERDLAKNGIGGRKVKYEIKVLNRNVSEFIELRRQYDTESLRKCFEWDAADDLQHAIEHYGKEPLFDPKWIDEVEESQRYVMRTKMKNAVRNSK